MIEKFLLPRKYRFVGYLFLLIGFVSGFVRFYLGIKPDYLTLPVFAIYSEFIETKTFQFITNNISEEITALFCITGLFLIAFSKNKYEYESTQLIRLRALVYSIYFNTILLILSTMFVYGFGFITVLIVNIVSQLALFVLIFNLLLIKDKSLQKTVGS